MAKRKTGTREWAESNYNIGVGCAHDCRYCYARASALRFKQIAGEGEWTKERVKDKLPAVIKKQGWVMIPTTHDITPFYLPSALKALKELLEKGNKVLIVTKPHGECISQLCDTLEPWKSQVLFRFTIGGTDEQMKFWEPGAPGLRERLDCLNYAYAWGYATSVSMEPMLGTVSETLNLFRAMAPQVTDKIWIGKMNKIDSRVAKVDQQTAQECDKIRALQSDEQILWLVKELNDHPKIAWKDSIKEVIEKYAKT